MESDPTEAREGSSPNKPEPAAKAHFHLALAAIVVPVAAFLISGAFALVHLGRPGADPEEASWKRRLVALSLVDLLVLLATIASFRLKPEPVAAPDRPPRRLVKGLPAGSHSLIGAWMAVTVLLAGVCLWIRWRRARAGRSDARLSPSPLAFWAMFVGLLGASDVVLVGVYALTSRLFGERSITSALLALSLGSATLLAGAAAYRAALLRRDALPPAPSRAATLPTVVRGAGYMLAGVTRVAIILAGLLPLLGLPRPEPGKEIRDLLAQGLDPPGIALLVFAAVILAPIGEEILFRGLLLPWLQRSLRAETAIWLSAVIFAVGHLRYGAYLLVIVVYGLVLGWARRETGNLRASIALHMLINSVATVIALLRR